MTNRPTFEYVLDSYLSRRGFLKAGLSAAVGATVLGSGAFASRAEAGFTAITHDATDQITLPPGYTYDVVMRWGDPLFTDAQAVDQCFGFNCDFIGLLPISPSTTASNPAQPRMLLVVNHEYTQPAMMYPSFVKTNRMTHELVERDIASHGLSVVVIEQQPDGAWRPVLDAPPNRRITGQTPMELRGPAAGHPRLQTQADPTGRLVYGTLNNCAGGVTPWGTILTAEENFYKYFQGRRDATSDAWLVQSHQRYLRRGPSYAWGQFIDRFDVEREPNEPLRFGWVVEIDPYDPTSMPIKRTALGRFFHEAATVRIADDGRAVVYSGDDHPFEYLYKFVSEDSYDPKQPDRHLLDKGTLYAARFEADGSGRWLPLVHGQGKLTSEHGFDSQADVLINARLAGDAVGATPMDRCEDVETNPVTGRVYVALTGNSQRQADQIDAANPRADNRFGHMIEIEEQPDHETFRWELFLAFGNPANPEHEAFYQGQRGTDWLTNPDNIAFDRNGRVWIATDGQPHNAQANDGVYQVENLGPQRGRVKQFLSAVVGAEICGPTFSEDGCTFFCSIQHPGEAPHASVLKPASRFPDYDPAIPPKPSVIAVRRLDGGLIGV